MCILLNLDIKDIYIIKLIFLYVKFQVHESLNYSSIMNTSLIANSMDALMRIGAY